MTDNNSQKREIEPPAMGERRARWGYGYQDKVATERILNILREDLRQDNAAFQGVRLADLEAGRVDDFVLVWGDAVEGNSIKWSGNASPMNWGELVGANGLLKELADGHSRLLKQWPDKAVSVQLQSNRPPSTEKHYAQLITTFSVAEFFRDYWLAGPTTQDSPEVAGVWAKLAEHTGLSGSALAEFSRSCRLNLGHPQPPGPGVDTQDWRHYHKQFEKLHKAIATWITDHPKEDFIERRFLLSSIGHRGVENILIQRFPLPEIPYEKNGTSAEEIKKLIESTTGGYIAVTGPAGVGKSTLVQDVLANTDFPYFIPYYAFLPDGEGNPRDRGKALTFFQDVIGRLDKFFGHRYSIGITEVGQGRDALKQHMAKANDLYLVNGHKAILLIDGLDHVSREVGLQNSILHELPRPNEIPPGFIVILSSQPQALTPDAVGPHIAHAVAPQSGKRVVVGGLGRPEIHAIIAKYDKPTTGTERDDVFDTCQGNPLILTFLLKQWYLTPDSTIRDAIGLAGNYKGDIEDYYQTHLAVPLQNPKTKYLLGLLCRAAPTIPVPWLQTWNEQSEIEELYEKTMAAYVRVEDGNLYFIHNSLIAFLKAETRSKLPGADLNADEQRFHKSLADRCGDRACIEPLGRARIVHLHHAGRLRELLEILSSEWLRQAISGFLPYTLVRPLLLLGIEAGWSLREYGDVVRLILLDYELDQRIARTEAGNLAEVFLQLDQPDLAISQIRATGRLLVEDEAVLKFAYRLWRFSNEHSIPALRNVARLLYEQAKPVSFFYHSEQPNEFEHDGHFSTLQAWARIAPLFEEAVGLVTQIKRLNLNLTERGDKINTEEARAGLFYAALLTSIESGLGIEHCKTLLAEIEMLNVPTTMFAALLRLARLNASEPSLEGLQGAFEKSERNDDLDLIYAEVLYRRGRISEAKHVVSRLTHKRFDITHNSHSSGLSDVSYIVELRRLQRVLELSEGPIPGVKDASEEALARIELTARKLGELIATIDRGITHLELHNIFRSLLLFHNHAVAFPEFDWRYGYAITEAKQDIYRQIVRFAEAIGKQGLESLRDVLLELLSGPASTQYYPNHRRYFAQALYHKGVLSREQALELGLSSTLDIENIDPIQRQKSCFEIATFLQSVGDSMNAKQWITRASQVSAGAGSHKDYHVADLAKWLDRSIGTTITTKELGILERFARAIEVAGGAGSSQAAMQLIESIFFIEPLRASLLCSELIDRAVLNVSESLEALIIGGSRAGASSEILSAVYCELMSLIDPGDSSDAAKAVLRSFRPTDRVAVAQSLMTSVRTNSLPSHRMEVGRALQDALRADGLGEHCLIQGLRGARNDSSRKSSLYKVSANETLTTDEVAARLSNADQAHQWNPNPTENAEFDWWSALKKVQVTSSNHLNSLVSTFPPPNYRAVELLAWKSKYFLESGDRNSARQLAEQAIQSSANASWFRWYDGAQKLAAYEALKRIDSHTALMRARDEFARDLIGGKLAQSYLLGDIITIFDFLEIEWPKEASLAAIDEYSGHTLNANQTIASYRALTQEDTIGSADEAICRFLFQLLAFPVEDVGVAARRALARYLGTDGRGIVSLLKGESCWDGVQLEHLLICLHAGSRSNPNGIGALRDWILDLNRNESIAVRGIARRICEERGWPWQQVSNLPKVTSGIILTETLRNPISYQEASMLLDGDKMMAIELYRRVLRTLEDARYDPQEMSSEFYRLFTEVEKTYTWAEKKRLEGWIKRVMARFWLNPRAILGRAAAMRLLGVTSLSNEALADSEQAYDFLYPIYDPALELVRPNERPAELAAMEWDIRGERAKDWMNGERADNWADYPESVGTFQILGERSWYIRPEWEWPVEERYRGVLNGIMDPQASRQRFASTYELTYANYLRGLGQDDDQLLIWNFEQQLAAPTCRWAAINSKIAKKLGWESAENEPFTWVNESGELMVKSIFWRDGRIWLEPPRFEALGEGWIVLASPAGINAIKVKFPNAVQHLWVERHLHAEKQYDAKWHLQRDFS